MKILKTSQIGKQGEDLASSFLQGLGYEILEQNYRYRRSEVDLIVKKGDFLVFVEVKKRKNANYGYPEAAVTEKKAAMIHAAAIHYTEFLAWERHIRFDIVAISAQEVMHFEDAY